MLVMLRHRRRTPRRFTRCTGCPSNPRCLARPAMMSSAVGAHEHSPSHAHSNANSSSASVAGEFEWIHCNSCYCDIWTASTAADSSTGTNSTTLGLARFAVTECTHLLCASCLSLASSSDAPGLIQCPICHKIVQYTPLTSPDGCSINPNIAQYFSPLLPQWSQLLSAAEYRQRNIDSLIRFLKDKLHLQRQAIERAAKELRSMRQLHGQYKAVVEENQALRMQLEHYVLQQQYQQHQKHPAAEPQYRHPSMHAPAPPSRQYSKAHSSFQRSHTTATATLLQRPPPTSATPASSHLPSHARSFSRGPSVGRPPPPPPTLAQSKRSGGAGSRLSLSRTTTSHAVTPTKPTVTRTLGSPTGGSVVSYSSGARLSTSHELSRGGQLRRAASTMTAAGSGGRAAGSAICGVHELRSQLSGR